MEMVQLKMEQLGIKNRSAYLRKMAVDGMVIHLELPEFQKLLSLMARTAANVNQIAQRCNATGNLYEEDVTELKSGYSELCEQMKQAVGEIAILRGIA
jgi:hypothetical protein